MVLRTQEIGPERDLCTTLPIKKKAPTVSHPAGRTLVPTQLGAAISPAELCLLLASLNTGQYCVLGA